MRPYKDREWGEEGTVSYYLVIIPVWLCIIALVVFVALRNLLQRNEDKA